METTVLTKDAIRFSDEELRAALDPSNAAFIAPTEWAVKLNRKEIKRMLSLAGVRTSDPAQSRPVDHLIADLIATGSGPAKACLKALRVLSTELPGLIEKSETADFRIDHRGFGFCRVIQIHRRVDGKTKRVDDFVGVSGLESVALAESFK